MTGAAQLVVHEALEMISCSLMASSLTPSTTVGTPSLSVGAEITTFFAPAVICPRAPSSFVKNPVDSMTTSIPNSFQGNLAGSGSCTTLMRLSPTTR